MKHKYRPLLIIFSAIIVFLLLSPVFAEVDNGDTIVYITETGGRYHSAGCSSLRKSKYSITLEEAISHGYTRCQRCNPPIYTGPIIPEETRKVQSGGSDSSFSDSKPSETIHGKIEAESIEQRNKTNGNNKIVSSGTVAVYVVLGLFLLPLALEIIYAVVFSPIKRFILYLYNLLPWVKKKKEKQRQEEQRLIAEAEEKAKLEALRKQKEEKRLLEEAERESFRKLKESCKNQKNMFFQVFASFSERYLEASYPIEQMIQDRQAKLNQLLLKNNAHMCDGIVYDIDGMYFGNKCTVYYSWSSSCYHLKKCRYYASNASHILRPPKKMRPCSVCKPDLIDTSWMTECEKLSNDITTLQYCAAIFNQDNKNSIISIQKHCNNISFDSRYS